jgi:oligosaccharide reducing-end xylanase
LSDRIQSFFVAQGIDTYGPVYTLDGKALASIPGRDAQRTTLPDWWAPTPLPDWRPPTASAPGNSPRLCGRRPVPSGQGRYYDGLLYLMSLMHLSGEYRIWTPKVADRK